MCRHDRQRIKLKKPDSGWIGDCSSRSVLVVRDVRFFFCFLCFFFVIVRAVPSTIIGGGSSSCSSRSSSPSVWPGDVERGALARSTPTSSLHLSASTQGPLPDHDQAVGVPTRRSPCPTRRHRGAAAGMGGARLVAASCRVTRLCNRTTSRSAKTAHSELVAQGGGSHRHQALVTALFVQPRGGIQARMSRRSRSTAGKQVCASHEHRTPPVSRVLVLPHCGRSAAQHHEWSTGVERVRHRHWPHTRDCRKKKQMSRSQGQ